MGDLGEQRVNAVFYHAGLGPGARESVHERFMNGDVDVIVAANAIGMGLDKPDVRFVYHPGPSSLGLSRRVNNLKTVSSRLLRGAFAKELRRFYWKPVLWHGAYYVGTVGRASLETVKNYVEKQGQGRWPNLQPLTPTCLVARSGNRRP